MKRAITFYNSFEEQEEANRKQMASLSTAELMLALRKVINIHYKLNNTDIYNLPIKHSIKIVKYPT